MSRLLSALWGLLLTQIWKDPLDSARDRVHSLPGYGQITDLNLYSGYIKIDRYSRYFYALAEAEHGSDDAADAPLIMWLNGGPGCSSVSDGFLRENGPMYPKPPHQLRRNHWSWTRFAHMIYLDQPAFVGFSYSTLDSDKHTGDRVVAEMAHTFLLRFLERYPRHRDRPLFLAGESYAGHYIPKIAEYILKQNENALQEGNSQGTLNLHGVLLGNPSTEAEKDNKGRLEYWRLHDLIRNSTATRVYDECNLKHVIAAPVDLADVEVPTQACFDALHEVRHEMRHTNIYDIKEPVCQWNSSGEIPSRDPSPKGYNLDPCTADETHAYLNRRDVQEALHVDRSTLTRRGFEGCTDYIHYNKKDQFDSMVPVYQRLLRDGQLRVMVMSGLDDAMEPHLGTELWLPEVGVPLLSQRDWRDPNEHEKKAGEIRQYGDGLTYVTVRGAGHMVAFTQPARAFHIARSFFRDIPL